MHVAYDPWLTSGQRALGRLAIFAISSSSPGPVDAATAAHLRGANAST
jgi:hypothetical protein